MRVALLRFLQLFSPPEGFRWRFPVRQKSIAGGGLWIAVFSFDGGSWWTYKRRVGRPSGMSEGAASLSSWGPTKRPVMAEMPGAGCCVRMKALRLYCLPALV